MGPDEIERAIREYLRAARDDPDDVRIWLRIADLQAKKGDVAEATKVYGRVAGIYREQRILLKAVAVYKQILKLDPESQDVRDALNSLYSEMGLVDRV